MISPGSWPRWLEFPKPTGLLPENGLWKQPCRSLLRAPNGFDDVRRFLFLSSLHRREPSGLCAASDFCGLLCHDCTS